MSFIQVSMSLKEQVIMSLKVFRKNKKISQSQLADRIGVSRDTIARLESGRARMYLELIEKIAHELNVQILELSNKVEQLETEAISTSNDNIPINYSPLSSLAPPIPSTTRPAEASAPSRNPYLDEKAVVSYGEPMKDFILDHRLFWHWVPEDKLSNLSISSVVEATLNQGKEEDIKWLFNTIGVEKAAAVFRRQIMNPRHGYPDMTMDYFKAYFNRHAPEYTE